MKNVVIIGAGPAGLTAALELLRRSDQYRVTVLEADDITGGISRTIEKNGNRMDIGGHRFYTKSKRVLEFWESLLPIQGQPSYDEVKTGSEYEIKEGGPDPEKSDAVMLIRRRVSRIYRKNKFYNYPVDMSTVRAMGGEAFTVGLSYIASRIRSKEEKTLEDFYINRFGRKLYSTFFEGYTQKVWGVHPSELPPDWGTQRIQGISVRSVIKNMLSRGKTSEKSLIKRFLYPKLGPGQLWECASNEIIQRGGKIIFNAKADRITLKGAKAVSVTASGTEYPADIVISSMPVSELIASIDSNIPDAVRIAAKDLQFRDFITIGIEVSNLRIKNKTKYATLNDIPPDCWIYIQDSGVKMGRLQIFNNWSPYMVRDRENKVFIGTEYFCSEGDELWEESDEKISAFAVAELEKIGIIKAEDVCDIHCERMRKAYPSYTGSYKDMDKIRRFIDSMENIYCVGRNGQHRYNNMDHSMLTAMTAVDVILEGREKKNIWTVEPDDENSE